MPIISSKGVASLKRLYLTLSKEERVFLHNQINSGDMLKEEINNLMRRKYFENKIRDQDYYTFVGDYGANLAYFLGSVRKKSNEELEKEANSPLTSSIMDRLFQPGRQKWLVVLNIVSIFLVSCVFALSLVVPVLAPLIPFCIGANAALMSATGIWFFAGSSDNTTKIGFHYENAPPPETLKVFNKYLHPEQKSPKGAENSNQQQLDSSLSEPLASVSSSPSLPKTLNPSSSSSSEAHVSVSGSPQSSAPLVSASGSAEPPPSFKRK